MGLQLILGSSGTGKTTKIYNDMLQKSSIDKDRKYLAVVPEQFTMETQKIIVELSPGHGTMDIDILSFDRLAKRIFDEAGMNTLEVLDDTGKCLIIRKIIEENKNRLTVFGSKVKMSGFIDEMKSLVSELYQYGIGEKELDEMLVKSTKKPLLYAKLEDIRLIMVELKKYLEDKFIMNEEILRRVCELIPESEIVKNSYITFDEYTGFSPVQYEVIRMLLKYAGDINVALTVRDADEIDYAKAGDGLDTFGITVKTVNKLKRIASDENVEIYSDIILKENYRFKECSEFRYLEENIFLYGKKPFEVKDSERISVHVCANAETEADYVAYNIKELVNTKGYRYKDIAVVTADISTYHRVITEVFQKHDVPCFIDYKRSVIANPMVESLRAVLEIISEGYSYESVFRLLKCGMSSLERKEIDKLENYVIRYGIRGYKRYSNEFVSANEEIDEDINIARQKFIDDTDNLYKAFKKNTRITVRESITALYEFVVRLNMDGKLAAMERYFRENNNLSMAKEYAQTYEKVMKLFDKTVFLIGDEMVNAKELAAILDSGFEDIKVGIIPTTLDRVVVGDIERTRLNNVKALFFIGVNDGLIPKSEVKGGVLTQGERSFLEENDIELSPGARENVFIQKYYLYLMLTKMSEKLYISFKKTNGDGKSERPSYLINTIMHMFKGIKIYDEDNIKCSNIADKITNIKSAKSYLAELIGGYLREEYDNEDEAFFRELYSICERYDVKPEELVRAAIYESSPTKLDKAIAKCIYGEKLTNSVSRLEKFAACAYEHFMNYGLNLQPRREFEVNSADIGSIYHSTIELFSKKIRDEKLSWKDIDDNRRNELINESVDEAVKKNGTGVFEDSARNRFIVNRIRKMAEKTAWVLQKQVMAGDFIPEDFELRFSSKYGADAMKYEYEDGTTMDIKGIIDRVDYYNDGDSVYIKIVDYKSGNKKLEINDIYNGLQLQLVLYMEAAIEFAKKKYPGKNIVPAALFYYNIDNPVIDRDKILNIPDVIKAKSEEKEERIQKCAQSMVLDSQKVNGFINNKTILKSLDRDIENYIENGGESLYIPVGYNKKGGFSSKSSVLTSYDMEKLMTFVHNKIGELGHQIIDGCIDVNPYIKISPGGGMSNGKTPCAYCEYNDICGFDGKISGYEYRKLIKKKDEEVWKMLRHEVHLENEDTEENVANIDEKEVETTKNNEETTDEKVNEGNIDKHIDDTEGGVKDGEMD